MTLTATFSTSSQIAGMSGDAVATAPRPRRRSQPPVWLTGQLATLYAGAFLNRVGGVALLFLVLFLSRRGYSGTAAGAAVSVYGAGNVLAALGGGLLADRLGSRRTIVLSMFAGGATVLAIPAAPALWAVLTLCFAAGAALELYRPASAALVSSLVAPEHRVAAFSMYRLAMNAGVAGAGALGGLVAAASFTYVFVLDAATCFAFGTVALLLIRTPPPVTVPENERDRTDGVGRRRVAGLVQRDNALLVYLLGATLLCTVFFQAQVTLPLRVRDLGLSPRDYGALMSLNGLLILAIQMPLVPLLRRRNSATTIAVGYLLVGVGFAASNWATGMATLIATVVVWTLGEILFAPVSAAYVAGMAPPHQRGRYQGAASLTYALGLLLAPLFGPALYEVSPHALGVACAAAAVTAAALVVSSARLGARAHTRGPGARHRRVGRRDDSRHLRRSSTNSN